jgi:hypothetical protein
MLRYGLNIGTDLHLNRGYRDYEIHTRIRVIGILWDLTGVGGSNLLVINLGLMMTRHRASPLRLRAEHA